MRRRVRPSCAASRRDVTCGCIRDKGNAVRIWVVGNATVVGNPRDIFSYNRWWSSDSKVWEQTVTSTGLASAHICTVPPSMTPVVTLPSGMTSSPSPAVVASSQSPRFDKLAFRRMREFGQAYQNQAIELIAICRRYSHVRKQDDSMQDAELTE